MQKAFQAHPGLVQLRDGEIDQGRAAGRDHEPVAADGAHPRPAHPMAPFSLVFLDPPYARKLADQALVSLRDGGWLTPQALLVVEEATSAKFTSPIGFEELERRAYDDTEFVILRAAS